MTRRVLNASRLQQEVSRRIQRVQEVVDDGVRIDVPRAQRQPPDAGGCNWTMKHFGNAAGFEMAIAGVLAQVQAEYNLADDDDAREASAPASAAKTQDDPFGGAAPERATPNPFGEAKRAERVNPFGEAKSAKAGDPFAPANAQRDAGVPQKKPPRDPFAND